MESKESLQPIVILRETKDPLCPLPVTTGNPLRFRRPRISFRKMKASVKIKILMMTRKKLSLFSIKIPPPRPKKA